MPVHQRTSACKHSAEKKKYHIKLVKRTRGDSWRGDWQQARAA